MPPYLLKECHARFRKRPVEVDAVQWFKHGDHPAVDRWAVKSTILSEEPFVVGEPREWVNYVLTLEGEMRVSPGDWIITGVKGEHYPCKPDIFAATYEPVSNP